MELFVPVCPSRMLTTKKNPHLNAFYRREKQFPHGWVPSRWLTAGLSNVVTFPSLPGFFHPSASAPFAIFFYILQAMAARARRRLEGEAGVPKFNQYPAKSGSLMTDLVPGPSNTAIKLIVHGDLPCSPQMNPPWQP